MDTSKEYIKMCKEAQEIQELRKDGCEWSDFYIYSVCESLLFVDDISARVEVVDIKSVHTPLMRGYFVWLPRQDQLQEIGIKEYCDEHDLVPEFITFFEKLNLKYGFSFCFGNEWDSLEKVWLSFIIENLYNKTWNFKDQKWEEIE